MMGKKKNPMSYKKGGMVFEPYAGYPTPAKCRAAGKCAEEAARKKK